MSSTHTHQLAGSYQQSTHSNCPPPQQVVVQNGSSRWWNDVQAGSVRPQYQRPGPNMDGRIDHMTARINQMNEHIDHMGKPPHVDNSYQHIDHSLAPPSYPGSPTLSGPSPPTAHNNSNLTVPNRKRKTAGSQIAPLMTPASDSSSSAGRKSNFTEEEDLQLCQSWLTISQDSVVGNGQTRDALWERITSDFQTQMKDLLAKKKTPDLYVERQLGSLQARWGPLNKAVNKYVGDLAKCKNFHGSGKTAVDIAADAHQMYFEQEKQPFKYVRCHAFLATAPKWHDYNATRSSAPTRCPSVISIRSTPALTDNDSDVEVVPSEDRPMGNKAAKRQRQVDSYLAKLTEHTRSIAESSASMALDSRVQSSAVDFLTDDVVLKTDTTTLKGAIKLYYEKKQAEILKKQEGKLGAAEEE